MKSFIRKVYSKSGTNSTTFNIPHKIAAALEIEQGDYLRINFDNENKVIVIKKLEEGEK